MGISPLSSVRGFVRGENMVQGEGLGFETSRLGSRLISSTQQLDESLNIPASVFPSVK